MKHLLISGNKFKEVYELVQKWFSMGTVLYGNGI